MTVWFSFMEAKQSKDTFLHYWILSVLFMAIQLWEQIWSLSFWGSFSLKEAQVSILLTNQIQNNHWKMWIGTWSNLFVTTRFHEKKQASCVPIVFHHLVDFRFRWYQFVAIFLVKSRWTVSNPLKCGLHNFWNVSSPFTSLHCYRIIQSTFDKVYIFWEGHKILRNLYLTFDCMHCSQK